MKVLQPFNTPTRRFSADAEVTAEEIDGALTLADWQALGFIEQEKPTKSTKVLNKETQQ